MIPAKNTQSPDADESSSPLAARLDLLLQHAITTDQFEAEMVQACRFDPDEIWSLLALLDQYHRLERLPTELFRALKAAADRYGLVRRELHIPGPAAKPSLPALSLSTGPRALPSRPSPPATARPPGPLEQATAATLGVGSVLGGRYLLETELASDDRGRIFQALDQQLAGQSPAVCQVAVHCSQPGAADFDAALAERRREFQLAQPLAHPNVLTMREFDQNGTCIYLTMNLMRGESLAALLAGRLGKALPRAAALTIIRDIGAAIAYAHEHGVVHGDLQPQSVQISATGELRVRGFGAQRARSCYASCEQLEGRAPDRRDDLYALACISYEVLHGAHPFGHLNAATARSRAMWPPRPIRLTRKQWRALRLALAWRREARNVSIERWLGRMRLAHAAKRLPTLENLSAMRPPKRSWLRPIFLAGCLAAATAGAVRLDRLPTLTTISSEWNAIHSLAARRPGTTVLPAITAHQPAPAAAATEPAPPKFEPALQKTASALATAKADAATSPIPSAAAAAGASTAAPARIELSAEHYTVLPEDSAARIVVRRYGDLRGETSFIWWTEGASATPDVDFIAWGQRVEKIPAGRSSVTLLLPIIKDTTRTAARTFFVAIGAAVGGARIGATTRATVLLPGSG